VYIEMELKGWLKKLINGGQEQQVMIVDFSDQPEVLELKDQIDRYASSKVQNEDYFRIGISKADSEKILNWERKMIETCFTIYYRRELESECTKQQAIAIKEQLLEKAELMHELRTMGADFPPKKMEKLAKLMQNSKASNGIIELGRINAKLGIVKQGAEVIFSEYDKLCKELGENPLEASIREKSDSNKKVRDNYVIVEGPLKIPVAISLDKLNKLRDIAINGGDLTPLSALDKYLVDKFRETAQRHNLAEITAQVSTERNSMANMHSKQITAELVK